MLRNLQTAVPTTSFQRSWQCWKVPAIARLTANFGYSMVLSAVNTKLIWQYGNAALITCNPYRCSVLQNSGICPSPLSLKDLLHVITPSGIGTQVATALELLYCLSTTPQLFSQTSRYCCGEIRISKCILTGKRLTEEGGGYCTG